jgi:hypothetical protein
MLSFYFQANKLPGEHGEKLEDILKVWTLFWFLARSNDVVSVHRRRRPLARCEDSFGQYTQSFLIFAILLYFVLTVVVKLTNFLCSVLHDFWVQRGRSMGFFHARKKMFWIFFMAYGVILKHLEVDKITWQWFSKGRWRPFRREGGAGALFFTGVENTVMGGVSNHILPRFCIWPTFQDHRGQSSQKIMKLAYFVTIWPTM